MINYGSLDNKMNGKYFMNSKIKSVRNSLFYTFFNSTPTAGVRVSSARSSSSSSRDGVNLG